MLLELAQTNIVLTVQSTFRQEFNIGTLANNLTEHCQVFGNVFTG